MLTGGRKQGERSLGAPSLSLSPTPPPQGLCTACFLLPHTSSCLPQGLAQTPPRTPWLKLQFSHPHLPTFCTPDPSLPFFSLWTSRHLSVIQHPWVYILTVAQLPPRAGSWCWSWRESPAGTSDSRPLSCPAKRRLTDRARVRPASPAWDIHQGPCLGPAGHQWPGQGHLHAAVLRFPWVSVDHTSGCGSWPAPGGTWPLHLGPSYPSSSGQVPWCWK